jgi:hypothetical protein
MLGELVSQHSRKSPNQSLGASHERETITGLLIEIERRQACGHTDPSGDRVELGDHHAVLGGDDVRSDDCGELVTKPFHAAVRQQTFRFSLVKVSRDPGWLEAAYTVEIEAVEGSIKG